MYEDGGTLPVGAVEFAAAAAAAASCSRWICSCCWRSSSSTRRQRSLLPSLPDRELTLPLRRRELLLSLRFASRLAAASSSVSLRRVTCRPSLCTLSLTEVGGESVFSWRCLLVLRWRRWLDGAPRADPVAAPAARSVASGPVISDGISWWVGGAGGISECGPSYVPWASGFPETPDSPYEGRSGGRVTSDVRSVSV